ncbi:hypothetical protein [Clostridium beijerinckii]|uniref:hypothetical protein n=1 Tax=Clostridium beijerinckii TaxID=1520 RepID=UPI001493E0D7|nr:hypothetical protein [Clostridium beijerinckii]NOW02433.1 flagellar biosynthesis protein FlhB [Clostridium beijerinckii]NOW02488.1 flagellar biosynthesis protein FlhB [Clostridium beijerinckii]NYC04370.1 flagellar biosynthesis protein FlhB [Clostridium beijerinckii]NYC05611.1 flagellar biosynthesis protein FlhB [Clostridium beijerinckii]
MFLIILVFLVGAITMFPLKKLAQKIYNDTGYNGLRGLPKFLTIFFGLVNIFLGIVLDVAIEGRYYDLAAIVGALFLLLIALLTLVNKKAGLKNAILLAILQTISGAIMIILLFANRCFGGFLSSGIIDILSINEHFNS